ncbi:histidinol-phosphate aminotransferase [Prevotella sp. CAG:1124]|nr:histidinol-phosphate aminotransferase [Prevotella sp. CAG:1124]
MRPLKELTRPNIWALKPYSSARDEYSGNEAKVFLDANENPYNNPLNRYPDPLQRDLKARLAQIKGVAKENIFLGNGSDEAIDLAYRCFTRPGTDNVVAIEPTYGMYKVCADINDIEYRPVLLDQDFQIKSDELLKACNKHTKLIWLCSPNNPTGNNLNRNEIVKTIECFDGLVIVDEAYSDFSQERPLRLEIDKYPNLIVLNTFSKAWGCAAIRLGMAFADKKIIDIFNKVKYPYNVNALTQKNALEALAEPYEVDKWIKIILLERNRMIDAFKLLPSCEKVYPTDANFFLAKMHDAQTIYDYLKSNGIIVRNRTHVSLCDDCLRITIGSKTENNELLAALRQY